MSVSIILITLGVFSLIVRRTLLGVLSGTALMALGGSSLFLFAGLSSQQEVQGSVYAFLILLAALAQMLVVVSLAVRRSYFKDQMDVGSAKRLRN